MKRFVLGDIHGGYKSLMQCLTRSNFNHRKDALIVLGDVCDGWPETEQCINELLKVKNIVFCLGNHDKWLLDYCKTGKKEYIWTSQGGYNTLKSYSNGVPKSHVKFLEKAKLWHIEDNTLFVHGGIKPGTLVEENSAEYIVWDRDLIRSAHLKCHNRPNYRMQKVYNEIFVGHTTTGNFNHDYTPVKFGEINDIDTGGGWEGKLTIMDLDTREYWQSDFVKTLYNNSLGRKDYTLDIKLMSKFFNGHP